MRAIQYGPEADQVGDLYVPARTRAPVVCLLHGGFWRMPYDRHDLSAVARDLHARGFAVWNVEYRRVGAGAGGWPATAQDVAAAIDHLAVIRDNDYALELDQVIVVGHSAGGQLALWAAAEAGRERPAPAVSVAAGVGLAPLADLAAADDQNLGRGAVRAFLGGSPTEQPDRYQCASPRARLPLGRPQLLIHGTADDLVPVEHSRSYVRAARAAGDRVELIELPGAGHMVYLDPAGPAHEALCGWLANTVRGISS